MVMDLSSNSSWLLFAIYASPKYVERRFLWDNLSIVAGLHSLSWVIAGDFNEVLLGEDKYGGRPMNVNRVLNFQECLNNCGMIDLGFSCHRFTQSNRRLLAQLIQERIDRVFVNVDWNFFYPEAHVKHLERTHSDHSPIVFSLRLEHGANFPRSFRFQPMCLSHPTFPKIVRDAWSSTTDLSNAISSFINKARIWNRDRFGNVFYRKKWIYATLNGI